MKPLKTARQLGQVASQFRQVLSSNPSGVLKLHNPESLVDLLVQATGTITVMDKELRLASIRLQRFADSYTDHRNKIFSGYARDIRDLLAIPSDYQGDILTEYSDGSNAVAFPRK